MERLLPFCLSLLLCAAAGCSGMKVIHPSDQNPEAGTKALDLSGGTLKIVSTYSCSIVAGNGTRVSALGKSEEEARKEALAKCRDQTLVSVCLEKNLRCVAN